MNKFIFLILSCASVFGADTSFQITTTTETNALAGSIFTMDIYTRDGQTNLMRTTETRQGVVDRRRQWFYHDGVLVGEYYDYISTSFFIVEAGTPYVVSEKHYPYIGCNQVIVQTKDYVVLDSFTAGTNGVFYPEDNAAVRNMNKTPADTRKQIQE